MGERLDRPGREGQPLSLLSLRVCSFFPSKKASERKETKQSTDGSEDEWKRKKLKWFMEESFQEGIE